MNGALYMIPVLLVVGGFLEKEKNFRLLKKLNIHVMKIVYNAKINVAVE
jgi:hypothetical protein